MCPVILRDSSKSELGHYLGLNCEEYLEWHQIYVAKISCLSLEGQERGQS